MARRGKQLELVFRSWGGKRKGAGRPKRTAETVEHGERPRHSRHHPVHVTLRVRDDVPSLRESRVFSRLRGCFAKGRDRFGFRLANYSVQGNHVHLIVEAHDKRALTRGLQGLKIRLARAVNRACSRQGKVFAERYHARPLKSPREVRRALVYVLFNERHHLASRGLSVAPWSLDSCSSAREFAGFVFHPELPRPERREHETTLPARCYLLRVGWRRHGLIRLEEGPKR